MTRPQLDAGKMAQPLVPVCTCTHTLTLPVLISLYHNPVFIRGEHLHAPWTAWCGEGITDEPSVICQWLQGKLRGDWISLLFRVVHPWSNSLHFHWKWGKCGTLWHIGQVQQADGKHSFHQEKTGIEALQAIFLTDNWHANSDVFNTHLEWEVRAYMDCFAFLQSNCSTSNQKPHVHSACSNVHNRYWWMVPCTLSASSSLVLYVRLLWRCAA